MWIGTTTEREHTQAVNTLKRIGTNDNVGKASTVLENEDCVVAASVLIRVTRMATVIFSADSIEAVGDNTGRGERDDRANPGRDVEGLGRRNAGNKGHKLNLWEFHFGEKTG